MQTETKPVREGDPPAAPSPVKDSALWSASQFASEPERHWLRDAHQKLLHLFIFQSGSGPNLGYLDGIRGVAVLLVIMFHCWILGGAPQVTVTIPLTNRAVNLVPYLSRGFVGVDLFFVLSGFLLSQAWLRADFQGKPRPSARRYFRHRMFRIVPGYYACLFIMLVFLTPALIPTVLVYSRLGFYTLAAHLLFLQYLFPITSADYSINGALWTLTMEATFYVVLPIAIFLFLRNRWMITLPILTACTFVWLFLSRHSLYPLVQYLQGTVARYGVEDATIRYFLSKQFPAHFVDFGLGIVLANIVVRKQVKPPSRGLFAVLTSPLAGKIYLIIGSLWVLDSMNRLQQGGIFGYYFQEVAFAVGFTLMLGGLVFGGSVVQHLFGFTPLRLIGVIGFSAYLWHMPLIFLVLKYPEVAALAPTQRFVSVLWHAIPLTIAVSIFFYFAIEKPFLMLGRRHPVTGAGATDPARVPIATASSIPEIAGTPLR